MIYTFELDKTIKHCNEKASEFDKQAAYNYSKADDASVFYTHEGNKCVERASEYRQVAEWLEDYKRLKQEEKYTTDVNISEMMHEIYMEGVNMGGEYQGCWVRYKDIERIIDKYF